MELQYKTAAGSLWQGDCLAVMDLLAPLGQFDLILTDPPYGTTGCKWDSVIPFELMWRCLNNLIKPGGAIVLFGAEPFSSALRMSNIKAFKYDWIWDKVAVSNPQLAKYQPLKHNEIISVFSARTHKYYPQGLVSTGNAPAPKTGASGDARTKTELLGHISGRRSDYVQLFTNYPRAIIKFSRDRPTVHPTQKPVALLEYLIKTYTAPGQRVLDFTSGSGSTGVACLNTGRVFTMIERDPVYCTETIARLKEAS